MKVSDLLKSKLFFVQFKIMGNVVFFEIPKTHGGMMFKKHFFTVLIAALILGNALIAHAQRIYLFSEGDYFDEESGDAVSRETDHVMAFFGQLPKNRVVIYNHSNTWRGSDFSKNSSFSTSTDVKNAILTAIRNCPARSSDKIVFYWAGYGAFDSDGDHYLAMPEIKGKQVKMYRSEILNALKAKGASLTVLVTDSLSSNEEFPYLAAAPLPPPRGGIFPIFNALFFNCSGVVDVNSARPGEESVYNEIGSFFTNCFFGAIDLDCDNGVATWKETLERVDELLQQGKNNQHVYKWSYPSRVSSQKTDADWSRPTYYPGTGDRIVGVNNIRIQDEEHFYKVIREADTRIVLTLVDERKAHVYQLMTDLNRKGSDTRLGIYVTEDSRPGVIVTGVASGSPATQCRLRWLKNDDL